MDREDGEMSDDAMQVDEKSDANLELERNSTVVYKAVNNGLVIQQLEKVDAEKLEERAKRFGLNLTGNKVITQRQIDELYANCGVQSGNERHFRFDTIHLKGVDGLSSKEIFQYLEDFEPVSLEWIDELSCNIVCHDHISAALALLVHSREIKDENLKQMIPDKSHHWREGFPHPKKDLIIMRFATNADKIIIKKKTEIKTLSEDYDQSMDSVKKNPWGDLCKSWGVYDHQEIFLRKLPSYNTNMKDKIDISNKFQVRNKNLAKRLGKRRNFNVSDSDESNSDTEWKKKSKLPRMRMHADDEETKLKEKIQLPKEIKIEKYAPLSIEVKNSDNSHSTRETTKLSDKFKIHFKPMQKKSSVLSRLGDKVVSREDTDSSDESENSDCNVMSQVQRVTNKVTANKNSSVWSRLETKSDTTSAQGDLRQIIKTKKQNCPDDLRDKLGKTKKSNLRIEIDNNYHSS